MSDTNTEQPVAGSVEWLKAELAYMTLQRDKLLEMTWLDAPGEPWESTTKWREQFEAGWVRRADANDSEKPSNEQETRSSASAGSAHVWGEEKPTSDGWYWVKGCPNHWSDEHGKLMPWGKCRQRIVEVRGGDIVNEWPWSIEGTAYFAGPIIEPAHAPNAEICGDAGTEREPQK